MVTLLPEEDGRRLLNLYLLQLPQAGHGVEYAISMNFEPRVRAQQAFGNARYKPRG